MLNTTFFDSGIPTVPSCKPCLTKYHPDGVSFINTNFLLPLLRWTPTWHRCSGTVKKIFKIINIVLNKLAILFLPCPLPSEAKRKEDQRFRNAKQKRQTTSFKCRRMTFGIMLIRPRTRQQSQSTKASIAATPPRRGARQTNEPQNNWPQPKQATNPDFFFFLLFKLKVLQSIDLHRSNNSA